jgi:hypothetical protein
MSADNYIFINRKTFEVKLMGASNDDVITKLGKGKNLEEAVDIACKEIKEIQVEYGIVFGEK